MKDFSMTKFIRNSIISFLNTSAAFERVIMRARLPLSYDRKIEKAIDKNNVCAAVLADLSNTFDYLKHDLFIPKLHKNYKNHT